MKKIFTLILLSALSVGSVLKAQTAGIQFIHDSPDTLLDTIDVYINGTLHSQVTSFYYLNYTATFSVPSGVPIVLGIAPAHSTGPTDTLFTVTLDSLTTDSNYIVSLAGISAADLGNYYHSPGVNDAFTAAVHPSKATQSGTLNTVQFMVFNGMFDIPAVDIWVRGIGKIVNHIGFGQYDSTGYLLVPAHDYIIDVYDTTDTQLLKTLYAPLAKVIGIPGGVAAVVYIAGYADTTHGPGFALYNDVDALHALIGIAAFPVVRTATAQFIHNAADPVFDSVDVYVRTAPDNAVIDSFHGATFRSATPFITLPSQIPLVVAFSPLHSTASTPVIDSTIVGGLSDDTAFEIIGNGIVNNHNFTGNPNNQPITFAGYEAKLVPSGVSGNTDLLFFNGVTDAYISSVTDSSTAAVYATDLVYGNFSPRYSNVTATDHVILATDSLAAGSTVYTYDADETGLGNAALTIFASGFVDTTSGPRAFGLWAAKADGTTYPLTLKSSTFTSGIADVSAAKNIVLYPNPANSSVYVGYSLDKASEVQYNVVNVLGQTIQSVNLGNTNSGSNSLKLNVATYAKGMYMLNLVVGNTTATTIRFVVE